MLLANPTTAAPVADRRRPQTRAARLAAVLSGLPGLGPVLCHARPERPLADADADRWAAVCGRSMPIPDHPWLHVLAKTADIRGFARLDCDGSRECVQFRDADGRLLLALWQLPDTDYYAWDRWLNRCAIPPMPARRVVGCEERLRRWCAQWPRRHWHVAAVRFRVERVAGLRWLGMRDTEVSPLARKRIPQLVASAD